MNKVQAAIARETAKKIRPWFFKMANMVQFLVDLPDEQYEQMDAFTAEELLTGKLDNCYDEVKALVSNMLLEIAKGGEREWVYLRDIGASEVPLPRS
jgi:hypothetical protein